LPLSWIAAGAGSPLRIGSASLDRDPRAEDFLGRIRGRQVLNLLHRHGFMPLSSQRILDVGCGAGKWLRDLISWGADPAKTFGVELLPASAARARRLCPPAVTVECCNAMKTAFPSRSFDIVVQATVFSGLLEHGTIEAIAAEMLRLVRPGGLILWYDVIGENRWNSSVHPLRKADVRRLFPGCAYDFRRTGLSPAIAELLAGRLPRAATALASLPPLSTHYLGAIRPTWD
jgi:SAM-dependent methyltransferase